MAGSGFFLGGAAQGINDALEQARKEALLELQNKQFGLSQQVADQKYGIAQQRVGLDQQGLDLRQHAQGFEKQRALLQDADAQVNNTMKIVFDTIAQGRA